MALHIFGIRHHGPGSARSVKKALEQLNPDIILVEGPPDADNMLSFIGQEEMEPPVALLAYMPDDPQQAVFYPFAVFSPEWQAIRYGQDKQIPVRFMDLPLIHSMALEKERKAQALEENQNEEQTESVVDKESQSTDQEPVSESEIKQRLTDELLVSAEPATTLPAISMERIHRDPLKY